MQGGNAMRLTSVTICILAVSALTACGERSSLPQTIRHAAASVQPQVVRDAATWSRFQIHNFRSGYFPAIVIGPDAAMWLADTKYHALDRVTTTGKVTAFSVIGSGFLNPGGLATGSDGKVYAFGGNRSFVRVSTTGHVQEFEIYPAFACGAGLLGPDGNIWFPTSDGFATINKFGKITEYPSGVARWGCGSITAGADGGLWVTNGLYDTISRIDPNTKTVTQFSAAIMVNGVLHNCSRKYSIASGPDGALYYDCDTYLGRMTTAGSTAEVAENSLNFGFSAETLAVGSDGNVWIATRAVGTIAKYDVTAGVLTYYVSPYRDKPASIAAGVDGNLWIGTDFTYDDVDIFHLK